MLPSWQFQEASTERGKRRICVMGVWYYAQDVGCPDFEAAYISRLAQHRTDAWWQEMEENFAKETKDTLGSPNDTG